MNLEAVPERSPVYKFTPDIIDYLTSIYPADPNLPIRQIFHHFAQKGAFTDYEFIGTSNIPYWATLRSSGFSITPKPPDLMTALINHEQIDPKPDFELAAEVKGNTISFSCCTRSFDPQTGILGSPYPGLYAKEFIQMTFLLFYYLGRDIRRISDVWYPDSVNACVYQSHRKDGLDKLEAAEKTWSSQTYAMLGFEVASINDAITPLSIKYSQIA
jgi:hypothetical protein